jgi:hypothetical protein
MPWHNTAAQKLLMRPRQAKNAQALVWVEEVVPGEKRSLRKAAEKFWLKTT